MKNISKKWWLNQNDFVKGLIITVITAILTAVTQMLDTSSTFNLVEILKIGGLAGLGYLSKNFITDNDGVIVKKKVK